MTPTFVQGDWLLVMWGGSYAAGRAVLVERESQPGVFLIKRVVRFEADKYWVEGDNKEESTDSRQWGAIDQSEIVASVILRFKRGNSRRARYKETNG